MWKRTIKPKQKSTALVPEQGFLNYQTEESLSTSRKQQEDIFSAFICSPELAGLTLGSCCYSPTHRVQSGVLGEGKAPQSTFELGIG